MIFSEKALSELKQGLKVCYQEYQDKDFENLLLYWDMVEETNTSLNLTRITGDNAVTHHLLDAASLIPSIPHANNLSIVDIGTGLGVPGLVLAILLPHYQFILLDALDKRIKFLHSVIERLGLKNVTAVHARAEEIAHKAEMRNQFDVALSRAVTALPALVEISIPFLKPNGFMLAMKGPKVSEEISNAAQIASTVGASEITLSKVKVPFLDEERFLAVAQKIHLTPDKFPRRANKLGLIK